MFESPENTTELQSTEMSTESESLFDRLGGATGVAEIVNEMYERVLADPELAPLRERIADMS